MRRVSDPNDPHRYDDMLKMKRPVSKNHPRMPQIERAAQFKPFAALSGYEEALAEVEKEVQQEQ